MKKRAALIAAIVTVLGLFTAPSASASCTQIGGVNGCVESIACRVAAPAEKVLGDGTVNCIM
jgi:hypothetical protein